VELYTLCERKFKEQVRLIGNRAVAARVLCVSTRTLRMSKTLWCSVRKTIQKRTDWIVRSRETGIHWLTVHKIIYRDLHLNCVKRRRAQQLSETNRVARLTRCKQLL